MGGLRSAEIRVIGSDDGGPWSWFVEKLVLRENCDRGLVWEFEIERWLGTAAHLPSPDDSTRRTQSPASVTVAATEPRERKRYTVDVQTRRCRGALSDVRIELKIHGTKGSTRLSVPLLTSDHTQRFGRLGAP